MKRRGEEVEEDAEQEERRRHLRQLLGKRREERKGAEELRERDAPRRPEGGRRGRGDCERGGEPRGVLAQGRTRQRYQDERQRKA